MKSVLRWISKISDHSEIEETSPHEAYQSFEHHQMPGKAIVTGATGLLGRQVVKAFSSAGYDVVGTGFSRASPPKILKVDIQNPDEIDELFAEVKYDSRPEQAFS